MSNMNISNGEDGVSKHAERGKEAEITSNQKECTSCAQNLVGSKTSGQYTSGSGDTAPSSSTNDIESSTTNDISVCAACGKD